MGAADMTDLPEGFVLDAVPAASPRPPQPHDLPDGFVLDGASPAAAPAQPASQWDNFKAGVSALVDDPSKLAQVGPGRLVGQAAGALTLPGDVATGKVDPYSDEGIGRAADFAQIFSPGAPARLTTQGMTGVARDAQTSAFGENFAQTARDPAPVPVPTPANPVVQAADRLGVPIPAGVATDSRGRQAITQAARQMPFGGSRIEQAVDQSLGALAGASDRAAAQAAGVADRSAVPGPEAVGSSLRNELQRSVDQREALAGRDTARLQSLAPEAPLTSAANLGDDIRGAFTQRVEANRAAQDEGYNTLRQAINPDQPVVVSQDLTGTLQRILDQRAAAAQGGLPKDLTPALDIATNPQGVTFNGLQRARTTLGERIDFEQRQGFDAGDLKRAYGALSEAMQTAVSGSARGDPAMALGLFRRAEDQFGRLSEQNRDLGTVAAGGSEALVNRMIGYASDLTKGNVERLRELQAHIPEDQRAGLSRLAFQRLGADANGGFDLARFAQQWEKVSAPGKAALFGDRAERIGQALQSAMSTQGASREANGEILRLLSASDESLARRVLSMASSGASADHSTLARMASIVGPEGMRNVASLAVQNLGANRAGEFSPAFFASNWAKMSEAGKNLLFTDKSLRASLDDIATVSARMSEVERRFANKSNTGRAAGLIGVGAGMTMEPMTLVGSIVGGQVLGRVLSQPATASSAAKWARAYEKAAAVPTTAAATGLKIATRNLGATIESRLGIPNPANDIINTIGGGSRAAASGPQPQEPE
jgi:hypothetical protein